MSRLREKLMHKSGRAGVGALPREAFRLWQAWFRHGVIGLPWRVTRAVWQEPAIDGLLSEARIYDAMGAATMDLFQDLGPIYGKAGQMALSRLPPSLHATAGTFRLTRLYKDWPAMPFDDVAAILDEEIPRWRKELTVDAHPLGTASLAQVHAATDKQGREWVIKVVRPLARQRLLETVAAMEEAARLIEPIAVTRTAKRGIKEVRGLCLGFRRELDLERERQTIERVQEKLTHKRQKLLVIPEIHAEYCSPNVITLQRFRGVALSDVVEGHVDLPSGFRQKLARKMLYELLVQVFELGLFHADPHAGNLILTDEGTVGLFDWGLAGELLDSDRRHIAAMLKAVLALDMEALIDALIGMAEEDDQQVDRETVRKELGKVVKLAKRGQDESNRKPSLREMLEACLQAAERMGVPVPDGLLMMAKSLITIEGLAKGLDPQVSLGRVATPVLLKAARPGITDLFMLGRRLPKLARDYFSAGVND